MAAVSVICRKNLNKSFYFLIYITGWFSTSYLQYKTLQLFINSYCFCIEHTLYYNSAIFELLQQNIYWTCQEKNKLFLLVIFVANLAAKTQKFFFFFTVVSTNCTWSFVFKLRIFYGFFFLNFRECVHGTGNRHILDANEAQINQPNICSQIASKVSS